MQHAFLHVVNINLELVSPLKPLHNSFKLGVGVMVLGEMRHTYKTVLRNALVLKL